MCPFHRPSRTLSANSAIRPSTSCTAGTTSTPLTLIDLLLRGAQRDVQDGTVLGDVDLLAGEHRVDVVAQTGLFGEVEQRPHRLGLDPVLRIVEVDPDGIGGEALSTIGVRGEQLPQVDIAQRVVLAAQCLPGRTVGQRCARHRPCVPDRPTAPPDSLSRVDGPDAALPGVSYVMPVLNEKGYVASAVASVLAQDYPGPAEVVLALGPSTDGTDEIVAALARTDDRIRTVANPQAHIPVGLNAAIRAARHPIVVRVDAHTELPAGYTRHAVATLRAHRRGECRRHHARAR